MTILAALIGAFLGSAAQPFVNHWRMHMSIRLMARRMPGANIACNQCDFSRGGR